MAVRTEPVEVQFLEVPLKRGREVVILLAGGDKSTQASDIKTALRLARNL